MAQPGDVPAKNKKVCIYRKVKLDGTEISIPVTVFFKYRGIPKYRYSVNFDLFFAKL